MSLPALRALRVPYPDAHIALLAKPWVAALYEGERSVDEVIRLEGASGPRDWLAKAKLARSLRAERFDLAVLLPNSFESAALVFLAGVKRRVGYARDGRSPLLTDAVPAPREGEIPRHERFYYLELLRRAGLVSSIPECDEILLDGAEGARIRGEKLFAEGGMRGPVIGVSPGAAFGGAKRWPQDRFAEAARDLSRRSGAAIAVFGSAAELPLCERVAASCGGRSFAGETTLREFIDMTAACRLFLANDSGAMHIAASLGVPSVTVFGPTDETATGPCGRHARILREPVECAPCKKRECPIDHRCMTRVDASRMVAAAEELIAIRC
jgi:heptosyltransferase-2